MVRDMEKDQNVTTFGDDFWVSEGNLKATERVENGFVLPGGTKPSNKKGSMS